jgi:uncharacterized protein (TIGR02145 family)
MKHILTISLCFLALSLSVYGQNNYSMSFDGVDDYVDLGTNENFLFQDLFSFEAWVKIPLIPVGNGAIIGALDSYRILIYAGNANNGALYVEFPELNPFSGVDVMGSTDLRDNMWHHLAVTYDGTKVVLYVDGLVEDSSDKTGNISLSNAQHSFFIGNSTHVDYEDFHGVISNLGLWKKSLSQQEIQYYMSCPLTGDEEGLVAYWNFEEGSGTTALDQTANGNDGTINGATLSTDTPEQNCLGDCTDSVACNFNSNADYDDGSCEYFTCKCLNGTVWSDELEGCIVENPTDSNLDGCTDLSDLLNLLSAYGDCAVAEVTCGDQIEHEGYEYSTVQIGEQCWFSENCRYLPVVSSSSADSGTSPYYYVYGYEGTDVAAAMSTSNFATYGVLYNWPAVMTEGICPSGWHIPSDGEWQTMEISLGMSESEAAGTGWRGSPVGDYMKSTSGWNNGGNGSNSSGFNGLPVGDRTFGGFSHSGSYGYWWSASESGSASWSRELYYNNDNVFRTVVIRNYGFSARCVRD